MDSQPVETKSSDILKDIVSYLPILTLASLGIGIINLWVYYYPFHLDILTYIDLDEVMMCTLANLIKCLVLVSLHVALNQIGKNDVSILDFNIKGRNKIILKVTYILFFTVLAIIFYRRYDNLLPKPAFNSFSREWHLFVIAIYFIIILCGPGFFLFRRIYKTRFNRFSYRRVIVVYTSTILVLQLTTTFSGLDAMDVLTHSTFGTYINIDGNQITSESNYYYIGRTKNFIFFYDAQNDYTDIYQDKDVKLLSINNKGYKETKRLILKKDSIDSLHKKPNDDLKKK